MHSLEGFLLQAKQWPWDKRIRNSRAFGESFLSRQLIEQWETKGLTVTRGCSVIAEQAEILVLILRAGSKPLRISCAKNGGPITLDVDGRKVDPPETLDGLATFVTTFVNNGCKLEQHVS